MQRTNIPPEILQAVLDSASNAADKGLSQFFTPLDFAGYLGLALPVHRPVIADFNCGAGHLLRGLANASTHSLLGLDIYQCGMRNDECGMKTPPASPIPPSALRTPHSDVPHSAFRIPHSRITADLTLAGPLLEEVGCQFDLIALNPPYRLYWHRARLDDWLGESRCYAVRSAYEGREAGIPEQAIDSTVATYLMALDRLSYRGEGLLIGNHSTLQRLLFDAGAPHARAAQYVWARVILPGNPMTGRTDANFTADYATEVIYFARDHIHGPQEVLRWQVPWSPSEDGGLKMEDGTGTPARSPSSILHVPSSRLPQYPLPHRHLQRGMSVNANGPVEGETVVTWGAVKDHLAAAAASAPQGEGWNLWLTPAGTIATQLSRFQECSRKTNKDEAARLNALKGQHPMQLVMQRAERDNLLHTARAAGWRVHPDLLAAVDQAIAAYHACRGPLYPLPPIQRLGYLDEHDWIECERDLGPFRAGARYAIRTQTVKVIRRVEKPNATTGTKEKLEYTGYELALYLRRDPQGGPEDPQQSPEFCFMDGSLRHDSVSVADGRRGAAFRPGQRMNRSTHFPSASDRVQPQPGEHPIDFTLQDLCAAFTIPDVPDVGQCRPEELDHYLAMLGELERLTSELTANAEVGMRNAE